jgi:hypothetical protein
MGQERVKGETATKVEIVLGVLFVLGALSSLGQGHLYSSQAVFSTVGMLFLGAYLLVRGIEWGQLVKAYRSYSTLLAHSPSGSISEIASAEGTTTEVVKRNLKLMIKRGMATNTAIDEQNNRVVSAMGLWLPRPVIVRFRGLRQWLTNNTLRRRWLLSSARAVVQRTAFLAAPLPSAVIVVRKLTHDE